MTGGKEIFFEEITDSKEVMQAYEPPVARWFLIILFALLVSAMVFLLLFQRDVSVSAQGIIESNMPIETVVSASGGKVVASKVEDGSTVSAGDVLFELDVDYARQQLAFYGTRLKAAESNISSLETLKQSYEQGTNLLSPEDAYFSTYQEYAAERSIILENGRIESAESQQAQQASESLAALYKGYISELNRQIGELKRLQDAIVYLQEFSSTDTYAQSVYSSFANDYRFKKQALDEAVAGLAQAEQKFAAGSISQAELDNARASAKAAQLQLDSLVSGYSERIQSEVASARTQVSSWEAQLAQLSLQGGGADKSSLRSVSLEQLKAQRISQSESSLATARRELETYQLQIIELESQIENGTIVANTDGTVMLESEIIAGAVIQPGSTLLYIVPTGEEYKVILLVFDKDIASVRVGEPAYLSISAFPYQEYGRLRGTITYVSATSIPVESTGRAYRVEAALPESVLIRKDGTREMISTGMTVRADIVSGTESWMTWLLKEINLID